MISPFFVGRIADRYFPVERVMAFLHLVGAGLLFVAAQTKSFGGLYAIMLAYCMCYFPTMSLANSLTFRNITNAGREFPLIRVPTILMIGDKDTTAIGKDFAPPEVRARLGHYPELAQRTKAAIPGAELIEFPEAGHAPQIQAPERFNSALIAALEKLLH